jgi:glycosyltransferase involved in cell wall biosynthesis
VKTRLVYHHRTRGTGVEGVHIRGVVQALERRGWEVTIVSPPGVAVEGGPPQSHKPSVLSHVWKAVAGWAPEALFEIGELAYNACSYFRLKAALQKTGAAAIYERYSLFGWVGAWLARRKGIPIVLEVNDATVITRSRPLFWKRLARRIEGWVFRNVTHVVTVSENFRDRIAEAHGIPRNDIRVLPNAVHPYQVVASVAASRPDAPFTLGMVAAFLPWHGLELVIGGTKEFLKRTQSRLVLVGDGPERSRIVRWIAEFRLEGLVELTGSVPSARVQEYVDQMHVCVIGDSPTHASPMKLFEYMSRGKAVIAPAVGSICEVITHRVDGWLFEPRNAESLLQAVEALYRDRELRERLGEAARRTVLSKHTWDHRAVEIESWLEPASGGKPHGVAPLHRRAAHGRLASSASIPPR